MPTVDLYNAVVRYAITLSNDHHITPQIQLHQICGARRCSIINTPSGRVILHPPFLTESCRGTGVPLIYIMNWVQVYRDDVIASIFGTPLTPALVATRWTRNCVTRANAHLRVQPAHCVYDFYFSRIFRPCLTVDLTTLLCVTLSPSNDHHITPQIQLHQICGARRCSIINTPSGRVILHPPFLTESCRGVPVPLIYI